MDEFCGSKFWNPNITWYTEDPKFTPCFEKTVLVWIPCGFLWSFAAFEISNIFNSKYRNIPWGFSNITKLLVNILLVIINTIDLMLTIYKSTSENVFMVDFFTPTIKIFTFSLSSFLLYHNKLYGIQSSGLLFIFWFLSSICNLSQMRTEITQYINYKEIYPLLIYAVYFMSALFMLILNCFADKAPLTSFYQESEKPCPEYNNSFLSRIFCHWFNPFVKLGYQRPLVDDDVWSVHPEDSSAEVKKIFELHWNESLNRSERASFQYTRLNQSEEKKHVSILPAVIKAFGSTMVFSGFLKFIMEMSVFISPYFLGKLITFINDKEYPWKGYLYCCLLFTNATITTLISSKYYQTTFQLGMRICTTLTNMIYAKALKLSNVARKDSTVGEIVNLMSVDVEKFRRLPLQINVLWVGPIQIAIALYFLYNLLGPSAFAGIIVIVLVTPINILCVRRWENLQKEQMEYKDKRLKLMSEILNGIKVLKLYAWEPSFEKHITDIRNQEIGCIRRIIYAFSIFSLMWLIIPFLVSIAVFATFVYSNPNNVLDSKTAFVALSLLNIIQFPLTVFPSVINSFIQAKVSLKRINEFLNSEELNPSRISHDPSNDYPIVIEDGTFSWDSSESTLKNIDLRIASGSLVAIVGNVGSGKSSLLSAILGEIEKKSGNVNTFGSIAYVSQQTWIQNDTLQNNILFGKSMNEGIYNYVVDSCALKADLEMLPAQDKTEIGEKGINLSGGQKQRVSLARSVYSNNDIYLLDDPLSAVDSHVGKHIFEKVIGPKGLLKKKTRLLVTHSITFLPEVDHIIVLKDGTISEYGTYKELLESKGLFADFLLQHINDIPEDESEVSQIKKELVSNFDGDEYLNRLQRIRSLSESPSSAPTEMSEKDDTPLINDKNKLTDHRLIEEERMEIGTTKRDVYFYYFKSIGIFLVIATLGSNFMYTAFSLGTNFWLSKWSSYNDKLYNNTNDEASRNLYLGVYGALGFCQAIGGYFYYVAPQLGFLLSAKVMHEKMLNSVLKSPLSFFETTLTGRILSRFSKDVDTLDESLPWQFSEIIYSIFQVIGILIIISISTPIFIVVAIPIGIVFFFLQRYYIATSRQLKRLESVSRSPVFSNFSETLSGVSTIRAYRLQERFNHEFEEKVDLNQKSVYANIVAYSWLLTRLEIPGNIIVLVTGILAVLTRDSVSPGIVGLSLTYAMQLTQTLSWLIELLSDVENNIVSVERIKEYGELNHEAAWEVQEVDPKYKWPFKGQLYINDLIVKYHSSNEPVLHNINCHINSGEKIGVVGRTGAGKSTLTLALFRIIEKESGQIVIDDVDISNLGLHFLRSNLTIIPQDPVLFTGSLRFNLDPFERYSDNEIWNSLEQAHLKPFVETLSSKLEHSIDEGGGNLSVGQRQLVCLARALLRKSPILILDEATAAVDLQTDDLIQQTIRSEFADCTILIVAHRINTIMDSNKILVLDKGNVVEFDSPGNLLQNTKSLFYNLAKDAGIIK